MMKSQLFLVASFVLLTTMTNLVWADPSIEQVYQHPDQYENQSLIFDRALLSGSPPSYNDGFYLVKIKSAADTYIWDWFRDEGFAFLVSQTLADQLIADEGLTSNYWYRCRLTVVIGRIIRKYIGYDVLQWVASIRKIEFYNIGGTIMDKVYTDLEPMPLVMLNAMPSFDVPSLILNLPSISIDGVIYKNMNIRLRLNMDGTYEFL